MLKRFRIQTKKPVRIPQYIDQKEGQLVVPLPEPLAASLGWKLGDRVNLIPVGGEKKVILEKAPVVKVILPRNLNPGLRKFITIAFLTGMFIILYVTGFSPWIMFIWAVVLLGATIVMKN